MKKFLLIIVIFVIFSIGANATSSAMVIIRSEERLADMRRMAEASNEELAKFLSGYFSDNGIRTREDLISFLELLDSLPLPFIPETQFNQIVYWPSDSDTYIVFSTEIGETHTLRYNFVNKNNLGELLYRYNINQKDYINVYSSSASQNFELNDGGAIFFIMEIDGFLVRAGYNRGNNHDILTVNPEEMYSDLIITSFREAPWSTMSVSFTTTDALTILRAIAGLTAMTDEEMARFEISGAPSTGDAMRLLRVVAGLV
ncbi:MAG: hypothetical protein LBC86_05680 [Oscillospiraceae bacterium]|jgi:hypothetical protein|nr:hypothetical protein [Oscillospiraceae bacterium]